MRSNVADFRLRRAILVNAVVSSTISFTIKGVALNEESQVPMVLLHNEDRNLLLPLVVGPFEASAIIIEMENVQPPRPLTHDLIAQVFERHHLRMLHVEIYGQIEDRYLARIRYRARLATHTMEVRPSDGIALAVRLGASIQVASELVAGMADRRLANPSLDPSTSDILYLETEKPAVPMM